MSRTIEFAYTPVLGGPEEDPLSMQVTVNPSKHPRHPSRVILPIHLLPSAHMQRLPNHHLLQCRVYPAITRHYIAVAATNTLLAPVAVSTVAPCAVSCPSTVSRASLPTAAAPIEDVLP